MARDRWRQRSAIRFYGEIKRVSGDDERMVYGYASTDQMADDGQIITIDALRNALPDYMAFANIRQMHQLSAVGTAREAEVDDAGLYIGAWVQDDDAWGKVKTRVYRGFSIGARATARDPTDAKIITAITLNEISLVDRPADPGAVFDVFRAAGNEQDESMTKAAPTDPQDNEIEKLDRTEAAIDASSPVTADAEAIEHAASAAPVDATTSADTATPAPVIDDSPVARAIAAAESAQAGLSNAVARATAVEPKPVAPLPGSEIRRGLCTVDQLGWMVGELAYLVQDADLEAAIEGDNSPVPAQLRAALLALAKAYRTMSEEEIKELLANVDVDVSLESGLIQLAAAGSDIERAAGKVLDAETATRMQDAFDVMIARGWKPAAPAQDPLRAERDLLLRAVETLTGQMTTMTERVGKLEAQPVPAKTAGPAASPPGTAVARSVGKGEDASGQATSGQVALPPLSPDDIKRTLDAMPAEDRALLLTRAALARPHRVPAR